MEFERGELLVETSYVFVRKVGQIKFVLNDPISLLLQIFEAQTLYQQLEVV